MKVRFFLTLVIVLFCAVPALAQKSLKVDLAQDHVDITTGFTGSQLVLHGVTDGPGDIAVVVMGPTHKMAVRRKSSKAGVWINSDSMVFKDVPIFYDYALSRSEEELGASKLLKKNGVGLEALYFKPEKKQNDDKALMAFQKALIRNKQAEGLFPSGPKDVTFLSDGFFRTNFYVPSNVPRGEYRILTFLIHEGKVVSRSKTALRVAQVGFSARLHHYAEKNSLVYALICVLIAVLAGWAADRFANKD